ncbi:MAG: hypothetical protein CO093_00365 [Alphaproteobacteria bacterium CG_4_9_14_3_um_filter_47_13]|nr:MAG: hypothetical protein CO093_00365 [Alphaproteobacteria bacterium CG_4_9_14_3_um_filter_47_13]
MNTEQLIDKLVAEGAQKPLPHPMKQAMFWLAGTMVWLAALSGYNGFRADMADKLADPFYVAELALLFGTPPGIAMFLIVRKGAPIQCCWAGSMATWSVTAFGYLCMRLIEQNDNPAHLIVWHALPIVLMCVAGMMMGKYALRWR